MESEESLKKTIQQVKEEYEEKCAKANLTEQQINAILKKRMALIKEYNDMQAITNALLAKYASIKNCSLRQAMDDFDIPDDL